MKKIINTLRNPNFSNKTLYVLLLPLSLLSISRKRSLQELAMKHWDKNPSVAHRVYWSCDPYA